MAGFGFTWTGLDEFKRALRDLPRELADEGRSIIVRHASRAEQRVTANYQAHARTGTLAGSVKMEVIGTGAYGTTARVRVTAKQATWLEDGTAVRQLKGRGRYRAGTNRGAIRPLPVHHQFIPVMQQERRAMYAALIAMMRAHGLTVEGQP